MVLLQCGCMGRNWQEWRQCQFNIITTRIVDGGTLNNVNMTLKPGASLLITNGGIVKTSHGFAAPVGTTVTVLQGKIE